MGRQATRAFDPRRSADQTNTPCCTPSRCCPAKQAWAAGSHERAIRRCCTVTSMNCCRHRSPEPSSSPQPPSDRSAILSHALRHRSTARARRGEARKAETRARHTWSPALLGWGLQGRLRSALTSPTRWACSGFETQPSRIAEIAVPKSGRRSGPLASAVYEGVCGRRQAPHQHLRYRWRS